MFLQPINPLEHPDWDATLTRRPGFSFFHGSAWTRVLVDTYGFTPVWLVDERSLLPLMEVDSWLTGRRGIGLPFTDDCAPLCVSEQQFQSLYHQAVDWGRAHGWKAIELRGGREFLNEAPASLVFYGHQLDLTADPARLFANMDGSVRQAVRKAERDGVTVEVSQSEQAVQDFYYLQCLTRKRHGLPPQPFNFFLNIWRHILSQKLGMVALASWRGEKVAGAMFFFLGGRAVYKFGASDFRRQQARPNNLVMWEAIQWLAWNGITHLHLGRTSLLNKGLRKFKLSLGAAEHRLEYVKYNLQKNCFEVETDQVVGCHNQLFRRLPVFMSRKAGELLYRHWA